MPGVFRRRWFPRLKARGGLASVSASPHLTGVQATAQIATVGIRVDRNQPLVGVSATAQIGTTHAQIDRAQPLVGVQATTQIGTVAILSGIHLIGVEATSELGTVGEQVDRNQPLVGVAATAHIGGFEIDNTITLIGVEATSAIGAPVVGANILLVGQQSTAESSDAALLIDSNIHLTGVQATSHTGIIVGDHPSYFLIGQQATAHVGSMTESIPHGAYGLQVTAHVPMHPFFDSPDVFLLGVKATAHSWGASGAGGGGGGAAGLNGPGQRGFDGASSGDGGHGGYADAGVVAGAGSPGADGNSGNELALGFGSGSGGAGASFTSTPGVVTFNYDGSIFINYTSSITGAPTFVTLTAADNGSPFIIPNDWTNDNVMSLVGSGCATHGDVTIVGDLTAYSPGDAVSFHVATYCEGVPTTWDIYSAVSGLTTAPISGGKGGDAGLFGGGGGGGTGGGFGRGGDGLIFLEYVSSIDSTTKTIALTTADNGGTPFTMPADWTNDNLVYLSGSGGNGSDGDISQGGNGGGAGSVAGAHGCNVFSPGEHVQYYVSVAGSGQPTIFGSFAASSGGSANKPSVGGFGVTTLFIYLIPGTGGSIFFPSTEGGSGFGIGGLGGGGIIPFPTETDFDLSGQSVIAEIGGFSTAGIPGDRVFIITGIEEPPVAPGIVMFPTSEDIPLGATAYIIGSSSLYTIGQVYWNGVLKTRGTDWQFVSPFTHIIEILDTTGITTDIRLIYFRWNIQVRKGFKVNDYPVPFAFINSTLVAERVPLPNQFFTVEYTSPRVGRNPTTMFARFPLIFDDMLDDHTIYDDPTGFETFRPAGYTVFDTTDVLYFTWDGSAWNSGQTLSDGTIFYVKRLHGVYQLSGGVASLLFMAGDPTPDGSVPEAISYPPYGESIGKNLLVDAFSSNAAVDYPSAYEIALNPGDFDPWANM